MKDNLKLTAYIRVTKHLCTALLILAASKLFAAALSDNELVQDDKQSCPITFNNIQIHENGKLCQIFATDFPASMIFHVPLSPNDVVSYYKAKNPELSLATTIKDRTLLKSPDSNKTLIISSDGNGTQVDILVKHKA